MASLCKRWRGSARWGNQPTNQSRVGWEKNSWHATSQVFTSVCDAVLYIRLCYRFIHSAALKFYTFGCASVLYIPLCYSFIYILLCYTFVLSAVIQFHKFSCETHLCMNRWHTLILICMRYDYTNTPVKNTTVCDTIMLWFVCNTIIQHMYVTQLYLSLWIVCYTMTQHPNVTQLRLLLRQSCGFKQWYAVCTYSF